MINLVKNALKFTHDGSITIWTAFDYENEYLHVHVVDTGKGIKPEELDKLFIIFDTIDRTKAYNPEGLGMGLNICQEILNQCDGQIEVSSRGEKKGSTFKFKIKMKLHQEEEEKSEIQNNEEFQQSDLQLVQKNSFADLIASSEEQNEIDKDSCRNNLTI